MKIVIDTEEIKNYPKKVWDRMTPEHITILGILAALSVPIVSDKIESLFEQEGSCCVEVTLERNEPEKKKQPTSIAKTKFVRIFNTEEKVNLSKKEFDCLSRNIYWETLHEPLIGQLAVAQIVYNRVKSKKWGNTFCQVIFQKNQFSWTRNKELVNAKPKNEVQWKRAQHSALLFSKGVRVIGLHDSEFYYAKYIKPPKWSKNMKKEAQIGQHIFFSNKTKLANAEEFE